MILFGIMVTDTALTLISWKGLNQHLGIIHDAIYDKADGTFSRSTDRFWDMRISSIIEKGHILLVRVQNLDIKLERNELRFFRAFPNIRIHAYEEILQRLRIKEQLKKDSDINERAQECIDDDSSEEVF